MAKKKHKKGAPAVAKSAPAGPMAFSFGDPEPVLDGSRLFDYAGVDLLDNGKYYAPPVPLTALAKLLKANAYHGPLCEFKVNMLLRDFKPSPALNFVSMNAASTDYTVFANGYFQKIFNGYGEVIRLKHLAAINMRRMKEPDTYGYLNIDGKITVFKPGEVLHIKNYDVTQSIYGVPWYLGALQSMLLNEAATLFRIRYYRNGAHMGYIFYSSSSKIHENDQDRIQHAIEGTKGIGNFRNMFIHIPDGREKDIQILPVGDFSTRDELEKIKNISRDDMIAAHRIPPAMANILPTNNSGFGDITKIDAVYFKNEVVPVQKLFLSINEMLPKGLQIGFITEQERLQEAES